MIEDHPNFHDQTDWFSTPDVDSMKPTDIVQLDAVHCGTVGCLAGWGCFYAAPSDIKVSDDWQTAAQRLFEISEALAEGMFGASFMRTGEDPADVATFLRALADMAPAQRTVRNVLDAGLLADYPLTAEFFGEVLDATDYYDNDSPLYTDEVPA